MILYFDTSALIKRYFQEPYSDDVLSMWKSATQIATSSVAYAETMATIYRKKREENLKDTLIIEISNLFREDWESFIRIKVNDQVNKYVDRAVKNHPLRGFDAIHLASAILIHERIPEKCLFVCFDERLVRAAKLEGFEIFPFKI